MSGPSDPATLAFQELRGEVALLRFGLEALAAKTGDKPINYSPTLGKLTKGVAELGEKLDALAGAPIIALSPEQLGALLSQAAAQGIAAPVAELARGREDLKQAVGRLGQSVTTLTVHGRSASRRAMAYSASAAAVATLVAWISFSGPVARALPDRWQVAERMAAATLALPRWDAGAQLMAASAPAAWEKVRFGHGLLLGNEDALAQCLKRAGKTGRPVTCQVKVAPPARQAG